jgi:hypothetical protein
MVGARIIRSGLAPGGRQADFAKPILVSHRETLPVPGSVGRFGLGNDVPYCGTVQLRL